MQHNTVQNLKIRYLIGLSAIAFLVTASFITMQRVVSKQRDFSKLVNLAGHQSGLTHRIAYFASLMASTTDESEFNMARSQVGRTIHKIQAAHSDLRNGNPEKNIPKVTNVNLTIIYDDPTVGLELALDRFLERARQVYYMDMEALTTNSLAYIFLTTYGPHVLEPLLDAAVEEYENIGHAAIVEIEKFEVMVWLSAIITLLLELGFIFRPLERRIKTTLQSLETSVRQLTNTKTRLLAAQKLAAVGDWEHDQKTGNLTWSDQVYDIFGVSADQFVVTRKSSFLLIHPEDRALVEKAFQTLLESEESVDMDYRILMPDGEERMVFQHVASVKEADGRVEKLVGTIQDITERKQAEEALRVSEERLELAMMIKNEGIWDWNLATSKTLFDERYYTMAGYTNNEFPQNFEAWAERVHPEDLPNAEAAIQAYLSGQSDGFDIELRFRRKDGSWMWIQGRGKIVGWDENGAPLRMIGTHTDITERKQAEETLRKSEEKYRTLFDSANDAIFLMEHERFIDCNNKTLEMFDCSMGEIIGQSPYRYSPEKQPDGRDSKLDALEKINAALNIGPQVFEWQYCRSDGSLFDAEVSLTVLSLMGRHHLLAIVRDISERKRAEEEALRLENRLNQAQKMEAIGTLAGGVAHDFNNILSGIFGYSQLAEIHIHNPEKAKSHIQQILKGAQRAAALVHQILTFSRQKETEKNPFRAYLEVKEALKLLRSSIPATIEIIEKIDSRSLIIADPTKIHQVVMNLCTNAYHAMIDRGGILNVSLKDIEISEPKYMGDKDLALRKYLQLEVSDTGHGMDDKTLEKAFDPYFTTKKMGEGTGFGLAIVKAIVEEHGGFLKVTSILDKGTNFYIHFPIIEQESRPKQIKNEMVPMFNGNETIMMVDDEEDIRLSCKEILESYGYLVYCFQNGIDAFKEFEKNPHQFDLIITDMTMPGMTGIELIEKIHDVRKDIPFILCSGFSGLINHDKIMQTGVSKYLMKPVLKSDLASAIRELIDKKSYPKKSEWLKKDKNAFLTGLHNNLCDDESVKQISKIKRVNEKYNTITTKRRFLE